MGLRLPLCETLAVPHPPGADIFPLAHQTDRQTDRQDGGAAAAADLAREEVKEGGREGAVMLN